MKKGSVVYFIDEAGQVRMGALLKHHKPTAQEAKMGAIELFELGHGFSTPNAFKTEKEAQKFREGNLYERTTA